MTQSNNILQEQIDYYRARAGEYDEWFLREGRYDRGGAHKRQWMDELARVRASVDEQLRTGSSILELACGTGQWTALLAVRASHLTAVDASPETIAINRRKLGERSRQIEYVQADLFTWRPSRRYDFIFFGFWLSHVPAERFASFWQLVADALAPGGRALLVDSLFTPESTAKDHQINASGIAERKLNDGRTYRIVKHFYAPAHLTARLAHLGWSADLHSSGEFFIYGNAQRLSP